MFRKRFFVKIEFQLHAITCPGVWLCTHGYLEVTIKTLGYFFRTGAMDPRFPLLCHDKFTMEGYFKSVGSMDELERVLAAEQVEITLWQNGRRLAFFEGKLSDVMHTDVPKLTCEHNINVQLLMKATPAFPGIIAPKVELKAQIGVQQRVPRHERSAAGGSHCSRVSPDHFITPKLEVDSPRKLNRHCVQPSTNTSTSSCFSYLVEPRRQRPVCHTKNSCGNGATRSSSAVPCANGYQPFEVDAVVCKSQQRRLSTCSSNSSYNLSQVTRSGSSNCYHSQSTPSISSISAPNEHQHHCHICKTYRKVFS